MAITTLIFQFCARKVAIFYLKTFASGNCFLYMYVYASHKHHCDQLPWGEMLLCFADSFFIQHCYIKRFEWLNSYIGWFCSTCNVILSKNMFLDHLYLFIATNWLSSHKNGWVNKIELCNRDNWLFASNKIFTMR